MLVQDLLEQSAARWPEKIALICDGQHWTYAQIESMANRLAHAFLASGVRRGDRVMLCLPNGVEMVVGIFAALKADAVFVGVSPQTREAKLGALAASCRPAALVVRQGATAEALRAATRGLASVAVTIVVGAEEQIASGFDSAVLRFESVQQTFPDVPPPRRNIDLDLACLIYTSGTTGEPKGVMCDHSNVLFVTEAVVGYLEHQAGDIILCVLPLAFSYGLYQLFPTFRAGATFVLESSFAYPAVIVQKMRQHRVTGFAGTPTIYALLLQTLAGGAGLEHLRYLTNAAAGLPAGHVLRLRELLPRVRLYLMHGLTEVARTLYLPPELVDRKPASVGIPMPGTEAWIADEAGQRLGPGHVGELIIRGRNVMRGYWEAPAATAERFRPGDIPGERICRTGDLFRTDEEGHFYFIARRDDIIKCRGEKVAPREVENALHGLDGVVEAAVVGVPDAVLGQAVKAFVVPGGPGLTAEKVKAHCRQLLEEHMVPKHVEFVAELPKTDSGKVKRSALRQPLPCTPATGSA